jgi:hypothetical protein
MHLVLRDLVRTPQRFPLNVLVQACAQAHADQGPVFAVQRCSGYGQTVIRWSIELEGVDEIVPELGELLRVCRGSEEWFYDVRLVCRTSAGAIALGIFDSTWMFLDGPEQLVVPILDVYRSAVARVGT